MCARRFLFIVFVLTLLVVGGAFALYQWGGQMLIRQAVPKGRFQAPPPSSAPEYDRLDAWIARPEIRDNASHWEPEGATIAARWWQASTFYIHPTTYLKRNRWNAPLSGDVDSDGRAELFVKSQASAFAWLGDVWAPRYRQAAYGAFLLNSSDAEQALDLAYADVRRAFEEFLRRIPPDDLIILAGHSQGARHLLRLLAERGRDLKPRLVAAYVVGWPVSVTADLPATGLTPCRNPDETGCVLSWQSFAEPANPSLILDAWEGTTSPSGGERRRTDMLCVNPITGSTGGAASPRANRGTLVPDGDLKSARVVPGLVGARCENGFLILDGEVPQLGPYVLPGNNYHVYDYALFWEAVRGDANGRTYQLWERVRSRRVRP
ncbi:MAG TPA: DUF3089 domain-containing protein [Sphingomicrobium sp.]|nr:DUF3089 domain-containing protein [Sphingomicrobium sp.]